MREINATFKKRKQNLLRQREKNIIRNGKFVRGCFLNETYEGGRQAKKSGHFECSSQFRSVGSLLS